MHLEPAGEEQYPGLAGRIESIGAIVAALDADLVVATGDLTNRGSYRAADFAAAKRWLDDLGAPYLALPGNHDLGANPHRGELFPESERYEDVPFSSTGYAGTFGPDAVVSMRVGDLTVIGVALRENDPDRALEGLETHLVHAPGPVVVAGHYPVILPRPWPGTDAFGALGYIDGAATRLADIIRGDDRIISYLCGHVHLTSRHPIGSHCMQFTAGALGPGAAALRVYDWDGAVWAYSTIDVAGPQIFWENFSESAREDPSFSSGSPEERAGRWAPLSHHRSPSRPSPPPSDQ
ncbi:MAG: hypothetical protein BGN97_12835 [Microbacterium sp. 69-10]|uniref:metallophosphoesterase family protein n=1 Tax=Microbacterium sp. 69-10 TaxID=1895783 RepID=UPI00095F8DA8|nr:MAG: hypothetical protein BGN97_12835 [Microbacterium sp. 69-10]